MKFADKDMCHGTQHYFSLFWAMECPYGVPCWGCTGCYWICFVDFWKRLGECSDTDAIL